MTRALSKATGVDEDLAYKLMGDWNPIRFLSRN
jgi:hypothetical protein